MMEALFWIAYAVLGFLFWRKAAGFLYNYGESGGSYGDGRIDWGYAGPSMVAATMLSLIWPVVVTGRFVYVMFQKHGPSDLTFEKAFLPEPKEIETRAQREQRERAYAERELA